MPVAGGESESVRRNRTYYDGDLAADLVSEALRVIGAEGPSAVSLRSLARALGVSHAAPRNHFRDKAALFAAIAAQGFAGLKAALDRAAGAPVGLGLLEAGVAYVEYALDHREHFAVMWQTDLHRNADDVAALRVECFESLVALVGGNDPIRAREAADRAWALVHGWAALLLSGSLQPPAGVTAEHYVRQQLANSSRAVYSHTPASARSTSP